MGLTATRPGDARLRSTGAWVAATLPLAYLLSGLDDRAWLARATPSLIAATEFDLARASSAPWAACVHLFNALPLGSLGLRAAFASALCLSATAAVLFLACETLTRVQGVVAPRVQLSLALGGAWSALGVPRVWQSGLDAGPDALSLLLGAMVLERLSAFEASWPSRDRRALASAGVALGILLAHEPLTALVLLPAGVPSALRALKAPERASATYVLFALVLGMGACGAALALGARPAQWLGGAPNVEPLTLGPALWDATPLAVGLGVLGAVVLLASDGAHRLGQVWTAALTLPLLLGWLGPSYSTAHAPDAGRYLVACAALAVLLVSLLASIFAGRGQRALVQAVALGVVALGAAHLEHARRLAHQSSARGVAAEWLVSELHAGLEPRALLLVVSTERAELDAALWAEGRERPDLLRVGLDGLETLTRAEHLGARHPELKPLLRGYLFDGHLSEATLQSVTGQRALRVEPHARVEPALYPALLPDGFWYRVADTASNVAELRNAARKHAAARDRLHARLAELPIEPALAELLARQRYFGALYFAERTELAEARIELALARQLRPAKPALAALEAALDGPKAEAFDAHPFVERW